MRGLDIGERQQDGWVILILGGRLDALTCAELRSAMNQRLEQGQTRMVVYLRRVSFLDSTAITELIRVKQEAEKMGGTIRLAGASAPVGQVINLMRLERVFGVYPTIAKAVAAPL